MKEIARRTAAQALAVSLLMPGVSASQVTGSDVIEKLAVPADDVARIDAGDIVSYSDRKYESTKRELAADAIVVVDTDLDTVVRALEGATTAIPEKVILESGLIESEADFDAIAYTEAEYDEVVELFKAKPGKDFNFSAEEFEFIQERLTPLRRATRSDQVSAASAVIREILIGRYHQYLASGLEGVDGYQRSRRKTIDVGQELWLTTDTSRPFEPEFPEFFNLMINFPDGSECCENYFRWLKVEIQDRPVFTLSHTMIQKTDDFVVYTERHYYVNSQLNSVQMTFVWVPYGDGTYMGLAMSASADILDSMLGKMLRPLGRNKAKDLVTDAMTEVRDALAEEAE